MVFGVDAVVVRLRSFVLHLVFLGVHVNQLSQLVALYFSGNSMDGHLVDQGVVFEDVTGQLCFL